MSKLGGYNNVPIDFMDITFEHLRTTGCRARIYMLDNQSLISWLQKRRLIRKMYFVLCAKVLRNLLKILIKFWTTRGHVLILEMSTVRQFLNFHILKIVDLMLEIFYS